MSITIAAVDIGGTKIAAGLVGEGQVIVRREIPTSACLHYSDALENITRMLREMSSETGAAIDGIGIGLTGRVDRPTGRIGRNDLLTDWQGRDLTGDLEATFQVMAGIENDADAAALAEAAWGSGKEIQRFIYVTVSTGIGGGIVLNERLYRGVDGCHPEIGHHVIDPSGPPCYCGARGCWERMASGTAMLNWTLETFPEARGFPNLDSRQVCDLARHGILWAKDAVRHEGEQLGIGLANLVILFAPEQIALGGGMMRNWEMFAPFALPVVKKHCGLVPAERIQISRAILGDETPLLGASEVWHHQFGK
jgi:glucokinase